ncbi:MAG: helix-turn-helix domain-containing protein [Chloroflexi bacterium]|nr:MAG: helix-turn-helix domain-containing protein [Chloroflexota bacterium]
MIKEISIECLLTTEDVADLLRIEPVTVRRLVARGAMMHEQARAILLGIGIYKAMMDIDSYDG